MKKKKFYYLRKLGIYLKPHRLLIVFICICGFINSLSNAFIPILEANIIEMLTKQSFVTALQYAVLICVIVICLQIITYISRLADYQVWKKMTATLTKKLAHETLRIQTKEFDHKTTGEFMNRIDREPGRVINNVNAVRNGMTTIITNLGIFFYICYINYYLGLAFLTMFLFIMLLSRKSINKKITLQKEKYKISDKTTSILTEMIRGIRDIKLLHIKSHFEREVDQQVDFEKETTYQADTIVARYTLLISICYQVFYIFILLLGIFLYYKQQITLASFIVIYMYRNRPYLLANAMANIIEQLKEGDLSCERMFEVLEHTNYPMEKFGTIEVAKLEGHIQFRDVTFQYDKKKILEHFNLEIMPNETVAIVGATGAGKSTIFQALTRSYEIQKGEITTDEIPLSSFSENSLYNNISNINQSPYIFNMSIHDNLQLVKEDLTEEEMIHVCQLACLDEFIQTLDDKYDTIVGEGGITLSGGERQRLAIARALLKKSEIILFDEATSSLDNKTQAAITQAIHNISDEYTVLIIAHRLSTIKECNRILVLDHGKIVGEGTHESLLKENKYYRELYEMEIEK